MLENVYFNLHFTVDPSARIFAEEVRELLTHSLNTTQLLPDIDLNTLVVTERKHVENPNRKKVLNTHKMRRYRTETGDNDPVSNDVGVDRQCVPIEYGYCSNLPYNITTFPNMLGHKSMAQVDLVIDIIKEVVDSGCHPLAYEMLCMTVQPVCYNDKIVAPCSAFCSEFKTACDGYIPAGLLSNIHCHQLPSEADGPGACISKPGKKF